MTRKLQGLYKGNIGSLIGNIYLSPNRKSAKRKKIIEIRKSILKDDYSDILNKSISLSEEKISTEYRLNTIKELCRVEDKVHGEQTSIKEGFVYLVRNSAYPGWIKGGMAIDYEKRLSVYNQYSPNNSFEMLSVKWVTDRRFFETILLEELCKNSTSSKGEWFNIDEDLAIKIFNS